MSLGTPGGPVRVTSGKRCIWPRADLHTAGDKRIITVETDRKYRARNCSSTSCH